MSGRVRRLFGRYAARHLALCRSGPHLLGPAGEAIGQINRICLHDGRLVVEGACCADKVALDLAGQRRQQVPGKTAPGQAGQINSQFRLELPFAPDTPEFSMVVGAWTHSITLRSFSKPRLWLAQLGLWPRFAFASLAALPAGYRWMRYHDMGARARVKKLLGLGAMVEEMQLDRAVMSPAGVPAVVPLGAPTKITILLPVYEAFDLLPEVLDRVRRHTDLPWHLIVIEDASPDPRIRPFLRDWAAALERKDGQSGGHSGRASVIENPVNLGFIGAVNRALAMVAGQGDPVVLLNSDAFVPAGWASRLVAPLADPGVASVTPMSNDAELMSVPVICARIDLPPGAGDAIDAVAQRLGPGIDGLPQTPTGVGFCMAISPAFLAQVPVFDPAFGRGYGEEVDWCQKVRQLQGRHLCLPNLFVEHRGGASFGSAAKQELLRRNGALISSRYPQFDIEVQRFIRDDPLVTARLALGLAWAGAQGACVPVYLAHAMGGGAEHYLADRIAQDLGRVGAAVVLRVGGDYRWEIVLHSPAGISRGATNDRDLMQRLLFLLPAREVIYSCGVADPDPVELPQVLLALGQDQRIEVLIHDYLPISPSYTLLDFDGVFRGGPQPGKAALRGHDILRPDGSRVDLAQWQAAWRPLLAAARAVVVFSNASRDLMAAAYPDLGDRLQVRPHQLLNHVPKLAPQPAPLRPPRPVIGVLGNVGSHKGAAALVALSRRLARGREADLVVMGHMDPAYDLARPAKVHGGYEVAQIAELVARYGITCWLIPSIWPETFSYTTHEALATGLPVICFDLGAQADAVRRAVAAGAPGAVLALHNGRADPDRLVAQVLAFGGGAPKGGQNG